MKKLSVIYTLLSFAGSVFASGEDGGAVAYCLPRGGEEVTLRSVVYADTVSPGEGCVWDLSDAVVEQDYKMRMSAEGDSAVSCVFKGTRYRFALCDDTMTYVGFENKLTDMHLNEGEIVMTSPLRTALSAAGPIAGRGRYADRYIHAMSGGYGMRCDADGMMITPDGDTIRNVVRITTLRTTVSTYHPADSSVSAGDRQMSELAVATSRLYAPGYRYPLLYHCVATSASTGREVSRSAYYIAPEEQMMLSDPDNEHLRTLLTETGAENHPSEDNTYERAGAPELDYTFMRDDDAGTVTVRCSSTAEVEVEMILANAAGMLYDSRRIKCRPGETTEATFTYGSLPRNMNYCVTIQTATEQFTEKFFH